jgi:hypothetical protein
MIYLSIFFTISFLYFVFKPSIYIVKGTEEDIVLLFRNRLFSSYNDRPYIVLFKIRK